MTRKREDPQRKSAPRSKGVMGKQRAEASRTGFVRELKRAARGLLDKHSPQR